MTNTKRWNATQELRTLQGQLNRMFEPFGTRFGFSDEELVAGTWVPPVDVVEQGDRILVHAELPGMKLEDLDIQFQDGVLTLRGERKFDSEVSERNYHRIERAYGTFVRSFTLPRSVDAAGIQANYENGILEVAIPKREEARPRQIKIDVTGGKAAEQKTVEAAASR